MHVKCKGCATGIRFNVMYNSQCSFQMMNTESTCPCTNCLVKVMCKSVCQARKTALRIHIPEELLDEGEM
jgi:hypothetical protein